MDQDTAMSTKPTGLAAFTRKGTQAEKPAEAQGVRKRAQGDTVALTVRLPRAEWVRLSNLAMTEGVSLQTLAIRGFDKVFADHGLPSIRLDAKAS
jgi:hypothetical protein